jgi:hypothetical protein
VARYSDSYGYPVADAYRHNGDNPNGDALPQVRCDAPFTYPKAPADTHSNEHADAYDNEHSHEHADAPADANTGSCTYVYTDLASDDL